VYACVGLLAGAVASMPKTFYKRLPEGDPDQVQHPYWWILNERACEEFSAAVFWEYLMCSLLLQGDAFAEILRPSIGSSKVIGLRPLHPQRVTVRRLTSGALYYVVQPVDGTAPYVLDASDMLHVPGLGFNGWRGMSVVRWAAKEAIGLGLATEEYSARFYGNGARPDFVFKTETSLDKKQREALLETWQGDYRGVGNAHMPAILTGGLGIEKISMSPEDAALIDVRGFQVEDLCRFFGTPPHMVGHTANTTAFGSGMESLGTYFTRYTLGRHVKKIEEEVNAKLWPMRATYFMECDMSGLERGDMSSRFNSYRIALGRAGEQPIMTVNEVRRREKLKPVPGGNELRAAAPAAAGVPGGEPGSKGAGPGGAGGEGGED
jgi:HK97 family phage portal protein